MWKNQFKIAWRNLFKSPIYAVLNLGGLAVGIAASFILFLYVYQELNYDRFFRGSERTYRVATDFFNMGGFASSQQQLPHYLKTECEAVESVTSLDRAYLPVPIRVQDVDYQESGVLYIDSAFLKVFPFQLKEGFVPSAGLAPNEVVLAKDIAEKYFKKESAIGKIITVGKEKQDFKVVAVLEKPAQKTHLQPIILLPKEVTKELDPNWSSAATYNYVKLKPGAAQADLRTYLDQLLRDKVFLAMGGQGTFEQWSASNSAVKFFIQPLHDIYLHSNYQFELSAGGNPTQVRVLGIIGIFIILIAGINYINLSTARSSVRAKEVGIKKTLGVHRTGLVRQFLIESMLFSLLAMLLAIGLIEGLLVLFENITGSELSESLFSHWYQPAVLAAFSILIGLLAGAYPAFYLTSFRPVKVLKGDTALGGNKSLRSSLVVVQFSIAIALIISSLVVYQQLQFLQHSDKGFEQEGVVVIDNIGDLKEKGITFKQEIEKQSQVVSASLSSRVPAGSSIWMYVYKTPEMPENITIQTFPADAQYIPTLGMRLVEGRNFDKNLASDSSAIILNEAAVAALNLEEPIGAEVGDGRKVIGVVKDFNFQSLRQKIEPAALSYAKEGYEMAIKIRSSDVAGFLAAMNKTWAQFGVEDPIRYHFLDENFAKLAEKEQVLSRAIAFFTLLTLFIACLGLLGLVVFTIEQRTKEIGIRKVLGASVSSIATLLSKDFMRLVLIANGVAFPLAWWAMSKWLEDFAYRIELQWWVFAIAGISALLIALITLSFQAIRAAVANPVNALKNE
ncbi:MAG: ABC transporter permease [Saprospiraceae bacterium]|nr:ABC transporter permease [Saprospiraceae bacterium]